MRYGGHKDLILSTLITVMGPKNGLNIFGYFNLTFFIIFYLGL